MPLSIRVCTLGLVKLKLQLHSLVIQCTCFLLKPVNLQSAVLQLVL